MGTVQCPWNLYCDTEQQYKIVYAARGDTPSAVCPLESTHTVIPESMYILDDGSGPSFGVMGNTTNIITVSKSGSDAPLLNQPYFTIGAALEAAKTIPNAIILIHPGEYNELSLKIPEGVEMRGLSKQNTKIKAVATANNTSVIKIENPNTALTNLSVELSTATENLTLKAIDITSNNATFSVENCSITVQSDCATGNHFCVHNSSSDVLTEPTRSTLRNVSVNNKSRAAKKAGVYSTDGQLKITNSQIYSQGVGAECASSSSLISIDGCTVRGDENDISQTLGTIELTTTTLKNGTTNNTVPVIKTPVTLTETYILRDEKPIGTNGGSYDDENMWVTRTLNTLTSSAGGSSVSLSNDVFTLAPGTYSIDVSVPAFGVKTFQCRLYNVTTSSVVNTGTSEYSSVSTAGGGTRSFISTTLEVSSNTQYKVEMCGSSSQNSTGLGRPSGFGVEVFTIVKILRLV